jgi:adenosylcobinamide kinase/adenosylcobinamide-phosphate guanylyltransferase
MRERIARHRAERPVAWMTVEEPLDIVAACRRLASRVDLVVVDCLTLWVSNLMERERGDEALLSRADELATLVGERAVSLVLVSNEVGEGVHPPTAIGIRFRDLLGAINQRVAAAADRVTLMVAGIPLEVKRVAPAPASVFHDRSSQAP